MRNVAIYGILRTNIVKKSQYTFVCREEISDSALFPSVLLLADFEKLSYNYFFARFARRRRRRLRSETEQEMSKQIWLFARLIVPLTSGFRYSRSEKFK